MRPMAPAIRPSSAPPVTRFGSAPKGEAEHCLQAKWRRFSEDEIAYIQRHLGSMPLAQIAKAIARHPSSIDYIARKLGLLRPREIKKRDGPKKDQRRDQLGKTLVTLVRVAHLAGIATDGRSAETLARMLIGISAWRPPNIHIAADLGHDEWFSPRPASRPTRTKPGSKARVAAYAARVEAGEDIWHPGDARPT